MEYFRVDLDVDEDAKSLMVPEGIRGWGIGAHYRSEEEISGFRRGPFQPETIDYYWGEDGTYCPDFVPLDPGVLTASNELIKDFGELLLPFSMQYSASVSQKDYTSVKPLKFLDLLDMERSIYRISPSGTLLNPRSIVLKSPPKDHMHFFGIQHNGEDKPFLLVSQRFKAFYDDKGLTGLKFKKAWPVD